MMEGKITRFQIKILKWIAKKIVIQGYHHKTNIITYYQILSDAARAEFSEDNKVTLDSFLMECNDAALNSRKTGISA